MGIFLDCVCDGTRIQLDMRHTHINSKHTQVSGGSLTIRPQYPLTPSHSAVLTHALSFRSDSLTDRRHIQSCAHTRVA